MSPSIELLPCNRKSPACPTVLLIDRDVFLFKTLLLFVRLALDAEVKRAFPFCAHDNPGCQLAEHREQNSLSHVGHFTATDSNFLLVVLLLSEEVQM